MAGQPFDYRLNVIDPFSAATQGLQLGATMEQMQRQREDRARALAAEERARQQQAAMQERVMAFIDRPTAQGAMALSALMPPDQAKSIREGWEMLDKDTQRGRLEVAGQALTALKMGKSDIAINLFRQYGEAARNSGDEDTARAYDTYADLAESSPDGVMANISGMIAPLPGGNEMLVSVFGEAKLPGEVREGEAKATTAEVAAEFARPKAFQDMEAKGWDIKKIMQDVRFRPLELSLRQQEAETARINAGLKGRSLSLDIQKTERDILRDAREYQAEAENNFDLAQETEDILARLTDPKNRADLELALGASGAVMPAFSKAGAIKQDIERLAGLITKDNMRAISGPGVMTDGDRTFALSVVSGLRAGGNQESQIKQIEKLAEKFGGISGRVASKYGMPMPVSQEDDSSGMPTGFRVIRRK